MGVFKKGLVYLFKDFSCWTSTHGIPHIGMANAFWLRILWIAVVAACIFGFLIQLQQLITKYLDFNVNTETKLEFADRPFPVITVCHLNPWKKSVAAQSEYMDDMIDAYQQPAPSPNFGFAATRNGARQQRAGRLTTLAKEHLFATSNEVRDEDYNGTNADPTYNYNDLVISCTYNAQTCNDSVDFTTHEDPSFGRCIVFNDKELEYAKTSSRAGPLYGLRLTIKTDQAEYLPWTDSSGVVVAIHNRTDPAFPDVFGYYAPPGTASSYGIRYVTTTRQPAPYGDCSLSREVKLAHYQGIYSAEACYRSCLQEQIIKQCSCYYPGFEYLGGSANPSCYAGGNYSTTSANLDCIDGVTANDASGGFNLLTDCNCQQPCEVQTYSVTVSTAQWPSNAYTPTECTNKDQIGSPWMVDALPGTKMNRSLCINWYKKNTLLLEIFYERMNFQVLTESPAYTFVSLISEIGGQVGLFLGMSIISVFELMTLIILLCFYMCSHRSRRVELEEMERSLQKAQKENEEMQKAEEAKEAKRAAKMKEMYENDGEDVVPPKVTDA